MKHKQLKTLLLLSAITCLLSVAVLIPIQASAQRLFPTIAPSCDQTITQTKNATTGYTQYLTNKNCNFDDFVQLFINLFDWGLAILSILSVVFFIIGGTMLLLSAGKEQTIQQGKTILANTFLGIVVALGGWLIINTVIGLLIGNGTFQGVKVFGQNWWGVKSCSDTYKTVCTHNNLHVGCGDIETTYVSDLQKALNNAPGCSAIAQISTDGCFGNQTQTVLEAFNGAQLISPADTAIKETWDALAAGKGCAEGSATQKKLGTTTVNPGCCVTQCGKNGVEGTPQSNGTDGCLDVYPNAGWYAGACKSDVMTTSGCCVLNSGGCIQDANKGWCSFSQPPKLPNGVFIEQDCSSLTTQCGTSAVQCS